MFRSDLNVAAVNGPAFPSLWNVTPTESSGLSGHAVKAGFHGISLLPKVDADVVQVRPWPAILIGFSQVVLGHRDGRKDRIYPTRKLELHISWLAVIKLSAVGEARLARQGLGVVQTDMKVYRVGNLDGCRELETRLEHAQTRSVFMRRQ